VESYDISKRERTILELVLKGKTNNEIADQLFISPNTVRNHIYNIYGKTQVKNRIQLKTLCDG
jgi:DNA-binding CsgD family transcriptional regulator